MNFEWIQSKSNEWVVLCDQKLLASRVDPVREAGQWLSMQDHLVKDCESIFILGLGVGYHIQALEKKYPNKNIIVFEVCGELKSELLKKEIQFSKTTHILFDFSVDDIFTNPVITKALKSSYVVLQHSPSVQMNSTYYRNIQNNLLGRTWKSFCQIVELREDQKCLYEYTQSEDRSDLVVHIHPIAKWIKAHPGQFGRDSMIWMALKELVQ